MATAETKNTSWTITPAQVHSITRMDVIKGTDRFLPPKEAIPKDFWGSNEYTKVAEALYVKEAPAPANVVLNTEFTDPKAIAHVCYAHLNDFEATYEHRIAGVAFMLSKMVTITPIEV